MKIVVLISFFISFLVADNLKEAIEAYRKHDFNLAFSILKPLAENNNTSAQLQLGHMYHYGKGVGQDLNKSAYWYKQAFFLNKKNACKTNFLFLCLKYGDSESLNGLAEAYYYGAGVTRDWDKARDWYKQAAEQGHPNGQFRLGWFYEHGSMGLYKRSYTGEQNYEKAFYWFQKAAKQDHAEAQKELAYMYETGKGTPKDEEQAFYWYQQSAKQYYSDAYINMAFAYLKGSGVDQDFNKSAYWYEKSEKAGHFWAKGKAKLIRKELVKRALRAKEGDPQAQYELGTIYHNEDHHNLDVPRDPKKAFSWYSLSAKQNYAAAQNKLGYMYCYGKEHGQWVEQDIEKSLFWYHKAADQGYSEAFYRLYEVYAGACNNERPSKANKEKADYWLNKANEIGYKH